jgi:integrase
MSFEERYKNRNFIQLLDNKDVKQFILSYPNTNSRRSIATHLYSLYTEAKALNPQFTFDSLFKSEPIEARRTLWSIVISYIGKKKYRTANTTKVYGKALYDFVNEKNNLTIRYRRNQQVPNIKVKPVEVPEHQQVYRLVDYCTHLKVKTLIALSYVSGTKGEGLRNLRIKDITDALNRQSKLREELTTELKSTSDFEAIKDLEELVSNLPLVIKITPELYPKRFRTASSEWYPCLVSSDVQKLLVKFYKRRIEETDNPNSLLFVTSNGTRYTHSRLSYLIKYNIKKFSKSNNGELKHTSPSMLRKSFFNRLISYGMKDIFREYLMGHSIGIKGSYFEWDLQKKEILLQYVRCNFNRNGNGVSRELTRIREDSISKDERIQQLENELSYFKSKEYTNDLVATVANSLKADTFDVVYKPKKTKTISVVIPIDSGKELKRLMKEGYNIAGSDDDNFYLEKEID